MQKKGVSIRFFSLKNRCLRLSSFGTFLGTFQIGLNHGQFTGDLYKRHIHTVFSLCSLFVFFSLLQPQGSFSFSLTLFVSPIRVSRVSRRHLGQDRRSRVSIYHHSLTVEINAIPDRLDVDLQTGRVPAPFVFNLRSIDSVKSGFLATLPLNVANF